jgi:hypothetical protein
VIEAGAVINRKVNVITITVVVAFFRLIAVICCNTNTRLVLQVFMINTKFAMSITKNGKIEYKYE